MKLKNYLLTTGLLSFVIFIGQTQTVYPAPKIATTVSPSTVAPPTMSKNSSPKIRVLIKKDVTQLSKSELAKIKPIKIEELKLFKKLAVITLADGSVRTLNTDNKVLKNNIDNVKMVIATINSNLKGIKDNLGSKFDLDTLPLAELNNDSVTVPEINASLLDMLGSLYNENGLILDMNVEDFLSPEDLKTSEQLVAEMTEAAVTMWEMAGVVYSTGTSTTRGTDGWGNSYTETTTTSSSGGWTISVTTREYDVDSASPKSGDVYETTTNTQDGETTTTTEQTADHDSDNDGTRNREDEDADGDGQNNDEDTDDDNDGVPDKDDKHPKDSSQSLIVIGDDGGSGAPGTSDSGCLRPNCDDDTGDDDPDSIEQDEIMNTIAELMANIMDELQTVMTLEEFINYFNMYQANKLSTTEMTTHFNTLFKARSTYYKN